MMEQDKLIERARYDVRAQLQMAGLSMIDEVPLGSKTMAVFLQSPYVWYEQKISKWIQPSHRVLELGAGTGLHTWALLQTGALVTASDISPNSLSLLKLQFKNVSGNLKTEVADMENLPFDDSSFDVIASAGSLSYGDPYLVDSEIRRVLRPGGKLICVDSLNHNPVYRMNRWLHYLRGNRSMSTLKRMPNLARIRALGEGFSSVNVRYFGALSFAMPVVARLLDENTAKAASDRIDQLLDVRRLAFKFVIVAHDFA
ncbi:class I SAM-dependent methyltransferase [Cyanobium sp. L1E-Cus]|uniref:class I SAM-dependent methyltransferase n=1 Tax=Cyanobium sp. L1E-Cus TaxID=2823714 RepID=UPI0020CCD3D8|nr:class I SAM-dependent methyltransferase [Cyanobium sp. L1E-Cus]MCP9823427.1 methyltransferase domain-containing protein [Cyanobium sp. L1E-Cus]